MNTKLNVVRFENEDVIATSGVCTKDQYKLFFDNRYPSSHGWDADYVEGKNASTKFAGVCGTNHGVDRAHVLNVQDWVTANIIDDSMATTAQYYGDYRHFTKEAMSKVYHLEGTKLVACSESHPVEK